MNDIKITYLTKENLQASLTEQDYWNNQILVPFSKNKARWICQNERIDASDYCAVLAHENNQLIGFIYLMPDVLNTPSGIKKKIYWLIYWWVDGAYKNTVLGSYMFSEALRITQNQVLVKSYAEHVAPFYNKMPFNTITERPRYTIFFSLDSSILLARYPALKHIKPLVKLFDSTSHLALSTWNQSKLKSRTNGVHYEYLNTLDTPTWNFIKAQCTDDLIVKTKTYVNWQISPQQFTQTPSGPIPYKALESGTSHNIAIHNIKITKDDVLIGFISYVVNYKEFNVKYFLVKDTTYHNYMVDALMEHILKHKSTFVFTDDNELAQQLTKRYRSIFTHKVIKKALHHAQLALEDTSLTIKNQDGHFY